MQYIYPIFLILIILTFSYVNTLSDVTSESFTSFGEFYRPHFRVIAQLRNRVYNNMFG